MDLKWILVARYGALDGKVYEKLFVRADSTWFDGRRQHVFIAPLSVDKHSLSYQLGTPQDLLFG